MKLTLVKEFTQFVRLKIFLCLFRTSKLHCIIKIWEAVYLLHHTPHPNASLFQASRLWTLRKEMWAGKKKQKQTGEGGVVVRANESYSLPLFLPIFYHSLNSRRTPLSERLEQ